MTGPIMLGRPIPASIPLLPEPTKPQPVNANYIATLPGIGVVGAFGWTLTADRIFYNVVSITRPVSIESAVVYVTTAVDTSKVRVAIYQANASYVPTVLVAESAEATMVGTGAQAFTLAMPCHLPPGRYCYAFATSAANAVQAIQGMPLQDAPIAAIATNNVFVFGFTATITYGASYSFPAAAPAPNNESNGTSVGRHPARFIVRQAPA